MSTVDQAVDRTLTESSLLSGGRPGGRPLLATVDRAVDRANLVHVVHTDRPGGRPVFSTGRPGAYPGLLQCARLTPLSSDLCTTFFHLLYLLSPYNNYLEIDSFYLTQIPPRSTSQRCFPLIDFIYTLFI